MGVKPRRTADKTELRERPAYGLTDAGRDSPKAKGVRRFRPLIHPPRTDPPVLPPLEYNPEFFDQRLRK